MPDLTFVTMQMCESINGPKVIMVPSETVEGVEYVVGGLFHERIWPTCTCPAYTYTPRTVRFGSLIVKAPCKHIKQAEENVCGWHAQYSEEGQTEEQREKKLCPRCGEPTVLVLVGT